MAKKNVEYRITLEDRFTKSLNNANRGVSTFEGKVMKAGRTLAKVFAGAVVLKAVGTLGKSILGLGADLEQTEIAFATFLGSAEKGAKVIEDLNQFANVTPFNNEEIIKSGRILLAANIPAEKLTETLKDIGDVAAGSKVPINELANIYAKSMNKGKLQAEELNQLAERGIPIISVLAKQFNVTKQEVFDLGSKGKITSKEMERAFKTMTSDGGIFFNLMSKQSKSATGLWSTFIGKMQLAGMQMGTKLLPIAKKTTKGLINMADKLIEITKIPLSDKLREQQKEALVLTSRLRNLNIKEGERKTIIEKLNEISPTLVKGIDDESVSTATLTRNLREFNKEQARKIVLATLEEEEQKLVNKEAARRVKIENLLYGKRGQAEGLAVTRERLAQADEDFFIKARLNREKSIGVFDDFINAVTENNTELAQSVLNQNKGLFAQLDLFTGSRNLANQTIRQLKGINKESGKQVDIAARIRRLQSDLGLDGNGGSAPPSLFTAVPGSELQDGITTIKSAAPKTFNINISKMIEEFNINTQNITESAEVITEKVTEALAFALADIQAVAR